jgi:hypothetical protein
VSVALIMGVASHLAPSFSTNPVTEHACVYFCLVPCPGNGTLQVLTATHSCDTGYTLLGESSRTCSQSDGIWSTAAPNCKPLIGPNVHEGVGML